MSFRENSTIIVADDDDIFDWAPAAAQLSTEM